MGPRALSDETILPDPVAYRDDMAHAAELLDEDTDPQTIDYVARFVAGVALSAGDRVLADAANALFEARMSAMPIASSLSRLSGLVQERVADRVAV